MRTVIYIFLLAVCPHHPVFAGSGGKASLSGRITDKETHEALPGVSVYCPDLKTGTISKGDGSYFIDNLPASKVLVKVSMTGYATLTEVIDLSKTASRDFVLEKSVTEISEVVVTGLSQPAEQQKVPTPISVVPREHLLQNSSSNIIDAVSKEPGLAQLSTGAGISKPVIRGLGYNRVVVVNDGIRQEGQQWGDEHGIEIDEYSVNKVEILKGPASLAYGSDAMAGVVHMISFPTLPEGNIRGNLLGNYQSNNGLTGVSGNLAGNLHGYVFDIRGSRKRAHAYQNKYDGYVLGTKFREENANGIFGMNQSWGYSHLHVSAYHLLAELPEGERDSATGSFIKPFALNGSTAGYAIASGGDFTGNSIGIPHQDIRHYKAVLNNSFVIRDSRLNLILGFQQNRRQEFADVLRPDESELYFLLNTVHYDLRYVFPEKDSLQVSAGINGMRQDSENKGEEFLIPEYSLFDMGGFITARKSWKNLDLSGGVRFDRRNIDAYALILDSLGKPAAAAQPGSAIKFSGFFAAYSNISGSAGLAYSFSEKIYSKLNLSRGFRAPNLAELGSNGVHEGTFRYELGNDRLKAETSLQVDLAAGINSEHVTAEVALFRNAIDNFIFPEKLRAMNGGDSIMDMNDPVPVFKFTQGNAVLSGGEASVDIHPHPLDWLHIENSFSVVNAERVGAADSTRWLPFTPAPRFSSELRAETEKCWKMFHDAYVMLNADVYLRQDKVYSAYGTETATPAYSLLNLGAGADVCRKEKVLFSLYISVNNLADTPYQNHLSRLKYTPMNHATGRSGIYDMGRNAGVKLVVPFGIRKEKE